MPRDNPLTHEVELVYLLVGVGPGRVLVRVLVFVGGTALAVVVASRTYPADNSP